MSLELLFSHHLSYLAASIRVFAFLMFVPVLGGQRVPPMLRVALALVLALVALPVVAAGSVVVSNPLEAGLLMMKEFVVGALLGFMVELVFTLTRIFGRVADLELGFGIAQTIDPQYGSAPLTGQLLYYTVILVWLAVNGHHGLLRGIVASFTAVPLQAAALRSDLFMHVIGVFAQLFTAAISIGLPFLVPMFLATVTMGVLARAMPQLNLLIVGLPLRLLVGFGVLMLTLPVMTRGFLRLTETITDEFIILFSYLN